MMVKSTMSNRILMIDAERSAYEAAQKMKDNGIDSLIVVENGRATGIVTERDFLERIICAGRDAKATGVKEIMSSPLITGSPNWSLEDAAKLMSAKRIRKLPIVENGALIGILTDTDIMLNVHKLHGEIVKVWEEPDWE